MGSPRKHNGWVSGCLCDTCREEMRQLRRAPGRRQVGQIDPTGFPAATWWRASCQRRSQLQSVETSQAGSSKSCSLQGKYSPRWPELLSPEGIPTNHRGMGHCAGGLVGGNIEGLVGYSLKGPLSMIYHSHFVSSPFPIHGEEEPIPWPIDKSPTGYRFYLYSSL